MNKLPFTTEHHEFYVTYTRDHADVFIPVTDESESGLFNNPIGYNELHEIVQTAKTYGINTVTINTQYGVDVHSHSLKTNPIFRGVSINKINNI